MENTNKNQGNTQNQGGVGNTGGEKFVDRFEKAIMQYVILNKAQQGEVTRDNLQSVFKGNVQMSGNHFQTCLQQLITDGHLKEVPGNKYTVTDDGREDVQKLQTLILELPQIVGQNKIGQQAKPGMAPQRTSGGTLGQGPTGNPGSNVGNTPSGSQPGNFGNNKTPR